MTQLNEKQYYKIFPKQLLDIINIYVLYLNKLEKYGHDEYILSGDIYCINKNNGDRTISKYLKIKLRENDINRSNILQIDENRFEDLKEQFLSIENSFDILLFSVNG
jgi:hypothetical protein